MSFVARYHVFIGRLEQQAKIGSIAAAVDEQALRFAEGGVHVVSRCECPTSRREQETMVAEMVVAVSGSNIEGHASIELAQVPFHIATMLQDEVNDVEIAVTGGGVAAISETQQRHC